MALVNAVFYQILAALIPVYKTNESWNTHQITFPFLIYYVQTAFTCFGSFDSKKIINSIQQSCPSSVICKEQLKTFIEKKETTVLTPYLMQKYEQNF